MNRIRNKLRGESGASLLLALLFFLLCGMVGASVLAAAASNGGTWHGNQVEQQRYFAVSSALRLVCDQLEKAEYTAKVEVGLPTDTYVSFVDIDGVSKTYIKREYNRKQTAGEFQLVNVPSDVENKLKQELDYLFRETFPDDAKSGGTHTHDDGVGAVEGGTWTYYHDSALTDSELSEPGDTGKQTLIIKLDVSASPDVGNLKKDVAVTVRLGDGSDSETNKKWWLYVEAELKDGGQVLTAASAKLKPYDTTPTPDFDENSNSTALSYSPVKWKLVEIKRDMN